MMSLKLIKLTKTYQDKGTVLLSYYPFRLNIMRFSLWTHPRINSLLV